MSILKSALKPRAAGLPAGDLDAPAAHTPTTRAPATDRPQGRGRPVSAAATALRRHPELGVLLLAAAVLNLWGLSRNGWANDYYAAAVRSMSTSWHDFLFASIDQSRRDDGRQAAARALGARRCRSGSSAITR